MFGPKTDNVPLKNNNIHMVSTPYRDNLPLLPAERRYIPAEIDDLLAKGEDCISISDSINPKMSDVLIAEELNKLTMKERDAVLHDLHGVADIVDEKPGFVSDRLSLLDAELSNIPNNSAYNQALEMSPDYVMDRSFRIMFLRADGFKPEPAARRMASFFVQKGKLFGHDKLTKKICLADLDEDAIDCLNTGYLQLLPARDRAGRAVCMGISKLRRYRTEMSMVSYYFF
jgi:hypothetical protein